MTISEKAKEKLDAAGKEIRTAVDSLKNEVAELSKKVKEKLEGTGDDMKDTAEKLTREVKTLSERVKELIPQRRRRRHLPLYPKEMPGLSPSVLRGSPFFEIQRAINRIFDEFSHEIEMPGRRWDDPAPYYYRLERYYGSFQRDIPLPYEVDSDQVDASFKDGILAVVLKKTKAEQEKIKRIQINVPQG